MHGILGTEHRRAIFIEETRRQNSESNSNYRSRLSKAMSTSGAQIAWLCVPPGPHIPLMVEAAISAGLHTVVEKPWLCLRGESDSLVALARSRGLLVAIHYEYCLLEGVENWRKEFQEGAGLFFGGRFTVSRHDPPAVMTIDNLRSHLLAIRAYAVPKSIVAEVRCGYGLPDERNVWVEEQGRRAGFIDFLKNNEPIIQRFIGRLESALEGADFPFDLEFASRVASDVDALKREQAGAAQLGTR
jgi:hypothetical protein